MVESYFRAENPSMSSYWIGLRQPTLGSGAWDRYAFRWEDNSPNPALNPSGQNYDGAGYSHWGMLAVNAVGGEPNNGGAVNQQCAAAHSISLAFSYYSGPFTAPSRTDVKNYIQESNSSRNLWSW